MKLFSSRDAAPSISVFDTFARRLLIAVIFVLPLVVLPAVWLPLPATKMTILAFGVLSALLMWVIARFKEHAVRFPDTKIIYSVLLLVIGYALSALLSQHILRSFIGFGTERDTVFAMIILVSALIGVALTTRKVADFMHLQRALLISFVVLGIFQIARVAFGGSVLFPGIFSSDATATLLGSWNDLAVLSGFVSITTLTGLALFSARRVRLGMYVTLLVALVLLVLVNVSVVWATLAVTIFFLMVYIFSDASYERETGTFNPHIPWMRMFPGAIVLLLSIIFLVFGSGIGATINKATSISFLDVRPSWEGTMQIGAHVYKDNLLFGVGPNAFQDAWVAHKSPSVNQTTFWNTDFTFGVGLIPTAFVTGGLVVGILWLLFFAGLIFLGIKIFSRRIVQPSLMYITVSSYVGIVYLWIVSFVYVPNIAVLAIMFMFTGASIAAARISGVIEEREVRSETSYASGLALTGALVVMFIVVVSALVLQTGETYTNSTLTRAVVAAKNGDLSRAERDINRASIFFSDVRTPQLRTRIGVAQLSQVLKETKKDNVDTQRKKFQTELAKTISAAQTVVRKEPQDYRGWLQLGDVYAQLVPLKIKGAAKSATQAYATAQARNTKSPLPAMRLAQLALQQKEYKNARTQAQNALKIKSDYTDAYYLLSQVAIAEKKTDEAISSTESAVLLRPNNAGLLFQLGILQYSVKAYKKAIPVLERAVTINPNYSNALYFLGLAYDKTGKSNGALAAFKRIVTLNPKNTDVQDIVTALESGKTIESVLQSKKSSVSAKSSLPVRGTKGQ